MTTVGQDGGLPAQATLAPDVLRELRAALPEASRRTVDAVTSEVAEYDRAVIGTAMGDTIAEAVTLALATFLRLASDHDGRGTPPLGATEEVAYSLGRGEARSGRTLEALLSAYRVGARTAWEELSGIMVRREVPAGTVARFAQLVFTYIDELSGASAAGHRDELATSGRVQQERLERLTIGLLVGEPTEQLLVRAERAGWPIPDTLTAVVVRSAHASTAARLAHASTLRLAGDLAPDLASDDLVVLLVPDAGLDREALLRALHGRGAVVGPTRRWDEVTTSYRRVRQAIELSLPPGDEPIDTDAYLVALVLGADDDAWRDLRARALRPLEGVRPATADKLIETLRSWLLHQGRREDVARELNVHPQTVRYRMSQVRELFGDQLTDPAETLALLIAVARPTRRAP